MRRMLQLFGIRPKVGPLIRAGDAANGEKRWADAQRAYEAALAIDPTRGPLWMQLGHALKEQGFLQEASAAYRRAATLDPTDGDPHLQLGHVMMLRGRDLAALAAFRTARARLPVGQNGGVAELALLEARHPATENLGTIHLDPDDEPEQVVRGPDLDLSPAIRSLLREHGLADEVGLLFDPYHYVQAHEGVRRAGIAAEPETALRHFCEEGIQAGFSISKDAHFEVDYYRTLALAGMPFTTANAYRHWLSHGVRQGLPPNRPEFLRRLLGRRSLDPDAIPSGTEPWTVRAEGFVADALDAERDVRPEPSNAALLDAVAERAQRDGKEDAAFVLRARIVAAVPERRQSARAYALQALERGSALEASAILERLCATGGEPALSFAALADSWRILGLGERSVLAAQQSMRVWPGSRATCDLVATLADEHGHREWRRAMKQARAGDIKGAQAIVAAAAALGAGTEPERPPPVSGHPLRAVAIVANVDLPQCRFYRVDQRVEQVRAAGLECEVFEWHHELESFLATMHRFDMVIFFRVPGVPPIARAIRQARSAGLICCYEIDDLIFDAEHYPDPFESYAGSVELDEHHGLSLGVPLFRQAMTLCEHGIASTEALAERMQPHVSGQVFVLRNGLGSAHCRRMAFAAETEQAARQNGTRRPVTIFYGSATRAHKGDFYSLVEPALVEIGHRHGGRVRVVLLGEFELTAGLRALGDRLLLLPVLPDPEAFWAVLSQADINLAMLHPSVAADCKSEIKWLEAAMFGIPSVVSDTATHRRVIRDGETGILCREPSDWIEALDRLVRDDGERRRIGTAARTAALFGYGEEARQRELAALLRGVMPGAIPAAAPLPLILVVNVFYPPQAIGGATRVVQNNLRDLSARHGDRFRFAVFTTVDGAPPHVLRTWNSDGVRVTGCGPADVPEVDRLDRDPVMAARFGEVLDTLRPALVHFHCIQRLTAEVVTATRMRNIPYLVTAHDSWWVSDEQFVVDGLGKERLFRFDDPTGTLEALGPAALARMIRLQPALFGAEQVLAVSDAFASLYRDCGVPRVQAVPNGVPPLEPLPRVPASDGRVRLGFIGSLARHKGWDLVRIALSTRPFANLALLAIDHAMEAGDSWEEWWGTVPVRFEPKTSQATVASLYARLDVLLAPSIWPESFGLVSREAARCGCWVVAADRGAIGEDIAEAVNGFRIDTATPDGLIAVLDMIERDPGRFRSPPSMVPSVRDTTAQADALSGIYAACLASWDKKL